MKRGILQPCTNSTDWSRLALDHRKMSQSQEYAAKALPPSSIFLMWWLAGEKVEELYPILLVFLPQQRGQELVLPAGASQWTASRTLLQDVPLISRAAKALSRASLVGDMMEKSSHLGATQIFPISLDSPLTHLFFPASWSILQTKQNSARHLWTSLQTGFAATCYITGHHNHLYSRSLM